jgi:methylated-DNA-[protein]-cysteine S-methyltransferase
MTTAQRGPQRCEAQARCTTPLGSLTLAATADGLCGAWFDGQRHHPGPLAVPELPQHPHIAAAREQLQAYFDGGLRRFTVALDLQGTDFQQRVWQALLALPAGTTCSYGALAASLGAPAAVRAVGAAVGRNPVSILVPCHRVLGANGSLTGYAGGLDRKQALLSLEAGPDDFSARVANPSRIAGDAAASTVAL